MEISCTSGNWLWKMFSLAAGRARDRGRTLAIEHADINGGLDRETVTESYNELHKYDFSVRPIRMS